MRSIILISEDRVKTVSNLDNNVFGKWLLPAIREAQDVNLQSIIGSTLYNQILTLVDSGDIALPEYDLYKDLLDNQIADFLIYQSLVNVIPLINVNMANMGTVISNDEHIQTLSQGNVDLVRGYYQNLADIYQKRLQDYLKCHCEYFPELNECGCGSCGIKPNLNSNTNTSGIWLGGLRNPQRVRGTSNCCGGTSKGEGEYKDGFDAGVAFQKNKLASTAFTENGNYQRENGWNSVLVNIDTDSFFNRGYQSGYTSGETHQKSLLATTAFTENGEYERENGWSGVTVNIDTTPYYNSGKTDGIAEQKALLVSTAVTANGTYTKADGYSSVEVNVPTGHTDQELENAYQSGKTDQKALLVTTAFTNNGNYTRPNGWSGVTVNIDTQSYYNSGKTDQKALLVSTAVTANGTYTKADGYSSVEVNVPTGHTDQELEDAYQSGYTSGETHQKSLLVATAVTANGTYSRENGYSSINVNVVPNLENGKQVIYDKNGTYVVRPTSGYDGMENLYLAINVPQTGHTDQEITDAYNSGKTDQKSLLVTTAFTENGTYSRENGWSGVTVNLNTEPYFDSGYTEGYDDGREDGMNYQKSLIQPLTITQNGTYSSEYGYSPIVVNVPSGCSQEALDDAYNQGYQDGLNARSRLTVSPTVIETIDNSGRTYNIDVSSNTEWEITSYPNWCSLSTTTGSGDTTVVLTLPVNTADTRTGNILYSTTDTVASASTSVIQMGISSEFTIVPNSTSLTYDLQTVVLTATCNTDWVLQTYPSWIVPDITSGTGNAFITLTISENDGDDERETTLVFKTLYDEKQRTVYIKQNANPSHNYANDYLTFEVVTGSSNNDLKWVTTEQYEKVIEYSTDKTNWISITGTTSGTPIPVALSAGTKVYFRSDRITTYDGCHLIANGNLKCNVYGNIMSLLDKDNFATATTLTKASCFKGLFSSSIGIIDASNLVLPATALTESCYNSMFENCSGLTSAPSILPATNLSGANNCYQWMFSNCYSLTTAPALPATTLADSCYGNMFVCCYSLHRAPELPATTLASGCYYCMFQGAGITGIGLPAEHKASNCYYHMFYGCRSLSYIYCMLRPNENENVFGGTDWVYQVAKNGIFTQFSNRMTWVSGNNGIPSGWTIQYKNIF